MQKALLRGFADTNGFLCVRARDGNVGTIAAKRASVQRDFYSFRERSGNLNRFVEQRLGDLESALPALRAELQASGVLSKPSKRRFDRYVSYALTRTRAVRHLMEEIDRRSYTDARAIETIRQFGIDPRRVAPASVGTLAALGGALTRNVPTPDPKISHLRTMVRSAATFEIRMRPLVWRHIALDEPTFITSDAGVAPLRISGTYRGLLEYGETIVVPLGSRSVAIGARARTHLELDRHTIAATANRAIATACFSECFHHPETPWPANLGLATVAAEFGRSESTAAYRSRDALLDAGSELAKADRALNPFARELMAELGRHR